MPNNSIISKNKMSVKNNFKKKNNKKFKTIKKKGGKNRNYMKKNKNSINKNKSKKVNRMGLKLKIWGGERFGEQGRLKKQKTVPKFDHDAAVSAVNATRLARRKRNRPNSNLPEPPPKERMTVRNEYNNKFLSELDIIITYLSNLKKLNLHNEKQEALSQFEGLGLHICQIIDWLRRERKQGEDESTPWEKGMKFNSNLNSEEKDEEEGESYSMNSNSNSNSNSNLY